MEVELIKIVWADDWHGFTLILIEDFYSGRSKVISGTGSLQ